MSYVVYPEKISQHSEDVNFEKVYPDILCVLLSTDDNTNFAKLG